MKKTLLTITTVILCFAIITVTINIPLKAYAAYPDYSLVFDSEYYAKAYPDVVSNYGSDKESLLNHFITFGMSEGRRGNESFDVHSYRGRYAELNSLYGDNYKAYYMHYMLEGHRNGYDGSFDSRFSGKEALDKTSISPDLVREYYDKSVFIGDSIMCGYYYYADANLSSIAHSSDFLAVKSFSLIHALTAADTDPLQPAYQGQKLNVWDSVALMDVDDVFIMFGTNDLVSYSPQDTYERYLILIVKFMQTNPDVRIHIISMTPPAAGVAKGYLSAKNVEELNNLMLAASHRFEFDVIDLAGSVADENGNLQAAYCSDNYVHHTNVSYSLIWESVLYNYAVSQLTGE